MTANEHVDLIRAAREAAMKAYAPYSNFRVGAAAKMATANEIFSGCNVENASYGGTICAERVALCSAVAAGFQNLEAIAISLPDVPSGAELADRSPCGICRQFIHEFSDDETMVLIDRGDPDDFGYDALTVAELLPFGFKL